ncbi:6-phosphofructokinase [Sinimarinibacterium sp. CAU 1509]|uniref:6-phosphofructokinase n=1 Tax=Sinimarinibacterium sp. CAU 1509 TaxID=2562283 RepID=UPI0010AC6015|nr:6-phosphofructokinase [Sinimarinibacterium sp. CAU 1509]TJY65119.1 6-phosphofructokinase [Sinimarinibacterium sp. CAU 1509]
MPRNAFYAQSGGVTAVINASAQGVIETARRYSDHIGTVYAGDNGILGALHERLIDTSQELPETIASLRHTPGGAFGSCRYGLKPYEESTAQYERLIEVFKAHNIGYFFYNGGGGSAVQCAQISELGQRMGYPIQAIHIPKTIDNDLPATDCCPGFGSAAKYAAVSIAEAGLDLRSMALTSTKVFILEVMGRNAGWIAAASGLASRDKDHAPHLILFPEVAFDRDGFLAQVRHYVDTCGCCTVVASEGLRNPDGSLLSETRPLHADHGRPQLGGLAPALATLVRSLLGYKTHYAVADYLMRSARHIASKTDVEQSYAVGKAAVELALQGHSGVMVTIERTSEAPYRWCTGTVPVAEVAGKERKLPREYITEDGYYITDAARRYLQPLIEGEEHPPYIDGIPAYAHLRRVLAPQLTDTTYNPDL